MRDARARVHGTTTPGAGRHAARARVVRAAVAAWAGIACASVAAAQRPALRVYISADMEGIAGVVSGEQLGPAGFEYGRFREFMTAEVLAAIAGARDAGATDIVVSDSQTGRTCSSTSCRPT
jgi:D-amino peptidase